jgi:predicted transcriptional regulator
LSELHGTRKKIYEYILEHPGSHFREISRNMEVAIGDLQYHLDHLETERYITSKRQGFYKRFYPTRLYSERQKEILSALQRETPRKILLILTQRPGATQVEITRLVKISAPTASWHMKKMIDDGLVYSEKEGRSTRYYISESAKDIEDALKSYHPVFWETWTDRFIDIWQELSMVKEKEKDEND